jgi:hypothetical protein
MLTTMATALLNAIPGESPETRLAAFAERLGAVYEGSCWRMSPAVRETPRWRSRSSPRVAELANVPNSELAKCGNMNRPTT